MPRINILFMSNLFVLIALLCACTKQQPEEKKSYFKRNEFHQGSFFRLAHHMPYQELKIEQERYEKAGQLDLAIKFLSHMVKKCENPNELQGLRLHMADLLFKIQHFADAAQEYQAYVQMYPGSEQAAYADFKAIQALNEQTLSADRDQEKTQQVVDSAKDFGRKAQHIKHYQKFIKDVEKMAHNALYRLYESEMLRFYFYLNRMQLKSASARLDWIKEKFAKYLDELAPEILELECDLAAAQGDPKKVKEMCTALETKHPKYVKQPQRKWRYALPF